MRTGSARQGHLLLSLLRLNGKLRTDAQRALQFVRSTPGVGVALLGMSRVEHVEENLHLLQVPVQSQEEFLQLFQRV